MMLPSFTEKTLPEKLSFELCLQFSLCFFVRLRACYYISFVVVRNASPPYLIRLSFFHFGDLRIKKIIYIAKQSLTNRGKSFRWV